MWLTVVIVGLSLAVMTLAALAVHRARLDRRRSDARVAALASAMDNPPWEEVLIDEAERPTVNPVSSVTVSLVAPDVERPSRAPAFAVAALVMMGAGTVLFVGMNGGSRSARVPVPASPQGPAIELVSMRHVLDGETLIVSGLVRNPATSATPNLSAVVSVLGRDGRVVARGESQLDPLVLEPGKETTFRVSVSDVGDPGRYRVAFVNGSQIVPHVDRRSDLARTALANDAHGN
jgi:hypothetical protein